MREAATVASLRLNSLTSILLFPTLLSSVFLLTFVPQLAAVVED